jgi:dienelactone hydrolase
VYAAHQPAQKAAVPWYGAPRKITDPTPQNPEDVAQDVKCPVLAFYGGQDKSIPQETIDKPEGLHGRRQDPASSRSTQTRSTASTPITGRATTPTQPRRPGV